MATPEMIAKPVAGVPASKHSGDVDVTGMASVLLLLAHMNTRLSDRIGRITPHIYIYPYIYPYI